MAPQPEPLTFAPGMGLCQGWCLAVVTVKFGATKPAGYAGRREAVLPCSA